MRRAAVLGSPIAHSLSPALHRAGYAALGLSDWHYEAVECDEAGLPGFLDGLDASWAGLSLTMPLKRTVLPLLDEVSPLAATVGGANTVLFDDGRRLGHNTDVYGIVAALREAGVGTVSSALILGGGATAASALAAVRDLGPDTATVAVRNLDRLGGVHEAAERLGMTIRPRPLTDLPTLVEAELVISTLPAGAADGLAPELQARAPGAAHGVLFDVVYTPWPTKLALTARSAGRTVVGGLPMLLHQAARQLELMTGHSPAPVEAMRAALPPP
ncbi:MAG: shikimate dehydrogenase [Streptosporangiales bacterium]|nr:shikimate dehydrogenase [Streptosporangiales bacterium]